MSNLLFFVSIIIALCLLPSHLHAAELLPYAPVSKVIVFTVVFNFRTSYRALIRDLRDRLREPGSYSHNVPVLPPQQNPPNRWINLELRTDTHFVTIRIRADNLYVEGFLPGGGNQWFELNNEDNIHYIQGSTFLGFDGGYNALEREAGRGRGAHPLGRAPLQDAVRDLATNNNRQARARAILTVVQMISEATRFDAILNFVERVYFSVSGESPNTHLLALENGWGALSAAMIRADHGNHPRFPLPTPNAMMITSAAQAAQALGLLLFYVPQNCGSTRMVVDSWLIPEGRALVQICSVRMDNIDGEDPGEIFGTITATDAISSQYIFNQPNNYVSVRPMTNIPITGPFRPISAASSFDISFDLKDYDSFSSNDEVSKGTFSWNVYDPGNDCNVAKTAKIPGRYGGATLSYIILSNAAQANVEVILWDGDGEDPADVFGTITAQIECGEVVLFHRTSRDRIHIKKNGVIPLEAHATNLPIQMPDSLRVSVELYDYDIFSSNDEIAKGSAQFTPQLYVTSAKNITGACGKVGVRVVWT